MFFSNKNLQQSIHNNLLEREVWSLINSFCLFQEWYNKYKNHLGLPLSPMSRYGPYTWRLKNWTQSHGGGCFRWWMLQMMIFFRSLECYSVPVPAIHLQGKIYVLSHDASMGRTVYLPTFSILTYHQNQQFILVNINMPMYGVSTCHHMLYTIMNINYYIWPNYYIPPT